MIWLNPNIQNSQQLHKQLVLMRTRFHKSDRTDLSEVETFKKSFFFIAYLLHCTIHMLRMSSVLPFVVRFPLAMSPSTVVLRSGASLTTMPSPICLILAITAGG